MKSETKFMIAGAAVAAILLALWVKKKGGVAAVAADVGQEAGAAVINLGGGVIAGASETIGYAIGIPRTSETECEKAKREGRTWDASFACPAGDFIGYLFN